MKNETIGRPAIILKVMDPEEKTTESFSVSLVTQGKHKFYTLTMPSDVLADTCFVTTRYDDADGGFQRRLDKERAQDIADYIDAGFGTIPGSIVLSAQPEAGLVYSASKKTIRFTRTRKAFLVIDGQHRVYGFALAKTTLRVPVVVYEGLSRVAESKLFIDINTKQRSVPNELLLDIKKLADYESDTEALLGEVFDYFNHETDSPLLGLLSPSERTKGKLSRVTFNAALKPLMPAFAGRESSEIYHALKGYIGAFIAGCDHRGAADVITKPTVFRAVLQLFPQVAQRVKDRHASYTTQSFSDALAQMFPRLRINALIKPPAGHNQLYEELSTALRTSFTL
jgi:DGQHR domain-containing protein